ncbi:conserved hypothetical protein [Histoplasma mississippiense (nom. inval.)]|uniref:conserved hypothetical protein n=1 Tax=Ajellomyces capsulatus (strain NAm1 / WU24) TaxID=2059318 RepID=UPI000157B5E7|nr:conserved hypothetical protein [Histoplasma mississippiense (nom. inval.)]EDN02424.1 conserved hypothetical protein [Histoplasma mississippiense (nom. inval.)]
MASSYPRNDSPSSDETTSVLGTGLTTRHLEAFGRKVTTTAGHLIGPMQDTPRGTHYHSAVNDIRKELRRPSMQRRMFSLAQTTPTDLVRSKLSTSEIQTRALSSLSDDLLANIPEDTSTYSLFQGFQASMPEEIYEIDNKIANLQRKRSMPVLHEHFEPGSMIRELEAHNDMVSAIDFDVPFGTMVSAALDDTVRVWDLNLGRCMGFLEGHHASVRCLQVEDNLVATGSMDASIRLWDLSRAKYAPRDNRIGNHEEDDEEDALGYEDPAAAPPPPPPSSMEDCRLFSLEAHVDEVTALYFRGDTLISGSADKTLRQWDLVKGRCVQTLDVLWAAAQASTLSSSENPWRPTGRLPDVSADFVGAVQCFDAALACGTADGMVRLWDLRSGQVHRSLVGHTGPVTCLQFDDVHLVTGSMDRSVRIWDLRTGSIYDAYAYDNPITSMMFDTRRIVSAAGEDVVKVYDKIEGQHWNCGAGVIAAGERRTASIVDRVRIKDGYMTEGRRDGIQPYGNPLLYKDPQSHLA